MHLIIIRALINILMSAIYVYIYIKVYCIALHWYSLLHTCIFNGIALYGNHVRAIKSQKNK